MRVIHYIPVLFCILLCTLVSAHPTREHDLHFRKLATVWDEGIPLGNGMTGALIWQKEGRLRFALDRSDLWDERPMKGLHRKEFSFQWVTEQVKQNNYAVVQQYFDAPYDKEAGPSKISGGALEFNTENWGEVTSVHLSLQKALCTVNWNKGATLISFVHATQPAGWFRFENINSGFKPSLVAPAYQNKTGKPLDSLKSNDPAKLGYANGSILEKGNKISYHQPGYNGFYYDIVVEWKSINANTIEGVWSVSSNYSKSNINANAIAQQALGRGYNTDLNTHLAWWKKFWNRSSLQLPDSLLERQWYLELYKFGSAARKGAPPILLQGVWTADNGKLPPWKGDYHHDLNTEMSYWPAYSANHLDEAKGFIDHLEKNKPNYRRYTELFFKAKGLNVPGVTTLAGTEMGGWIQYALSPTVSAWLAHHFYLQWKYSMDPAFLSNNAYPWLKEVAAYLESITRIDADGFLELPASSSPEINNNAIDAWFNKITNYDLSLMRFVFKAAAEMAAYQNLKADELHFIKLLSKCRQLVVSQNHELMYAPGFPYKESHRHFSHAMSIYPLGLMKWEDGDEAKSIIINSVALLDSIGPSGWNGYSYSWLSCLQARAKNGDAAAKALQIFATAFCSVNSFHVNGDQTKSGYSARSYRPFTLEGNFGAAAAMQEMLLQSYAGFIEVFPAIPASWHEVSFTRLRAEGAFLVSAKKRNGNVSEIKIGSEKGGVVKLKLPFEKYKIIEAKGIRVSKTSEGLVQLNCKLGGEIRIVREM